MTDKQKPQTLTDEMVEDVQGGGVMTTTVGGWGVKATDGPRGVWKAPAGVEAGVTETDHRGDSFMESGGNPKI